jgi:hypothetical protein
MYARNKKQTKFLGTLCILKSNYVVVFYLQCYLLASHLVFVLFIAFFVVLFIAFFVIWTYGRSNALEGFGRRTPHSALSKTSTFSCIFVSSTLLSLPSPKKYTVTNKNTKT